MSGSVTPAGRTFRDALGRDLHLPRAPRRVVSLVPSETESVVALAGVDRLVGRTVWCDAPRGTVEVVPTVGGTKDVDVEAVLALAPDLVLANQEENGRAAVERLLAAGAPVHVSFPKTVDAAVAYVEQLAAMLDLDPAAHDVVRALREVFEEAQAAAAARPARVAAFVPIWRDPWMTFDGRAFASDVLELAGFRNVFSDRPRRYPLAADLGRRAPLPAARVGDRDTRYPRVTLEEVAARAPEVVLLPDEPYPFDAHAAAALSAEPALARLAAVARGRVRCVEGKPLFWYGVRLVEGLPALARLRDDVASGLDP